MKKLSAMLIFVLVASFCAIVPLQTVSAQITPGTLTPDTLTATLQPGESITETKTVIITEDFWDNLWNWLWYHGPTYVALVAAPGYESWLTGVSPPWHDGWTTEPLVFDIEITVPADTTPGDYSFEIWSIVKTEIGEWNIDWQAVRITVVPIPQVIPEYPFGTILGVVMALAALGVFKSKRIPHLKM